MIEAKGVTFYDLFAKSETSQICIPDYQRGYSWEKPEVQDFFDDLISFSDSEAKNKSDSMYFLGPIVIMSGNPSDLSSYAVDGQQRIATFIILLSVMRDLCNELFEEGSDLLESTLADEIHKNYIESVGAGGGSRMSLKLGDIDQAFFKKYIQKYHRDDRIVPQNESNGRIKKARNLIDNLLRSKVLMSGGVIKPNALGYLNKLYINVTKNVCMVSIDVNGERDAMSVFERINVRGKPLSESDLIRHKLMSSCKNKNDRGRLRSYWDNLERMLGRQHGKIDAFMKYMWASHHGDVSLSKLYDEISSYLSESNITALDFVQDCVNDCRIYTDLLIRDSHLIHNKSRQAVYAIHATLQSKQALPLLISAYRRFQSTPNFSKLALTMESVIIRHKYFANHDSVELGRAFNRAAKKINDAKSNEQALQSALSILKMINPSNQQVISGVRRQMRLQTNPATYILRQLENYYSGNDDSYRAQATLEHIFPQKATIPEWGVRVESLSPYLWHLGNLTLLSSSDNSAASNRKFSYKKNRIYKKSKLKITSDIEKIRAWGKDPILRRAEMLAKLANQRWVID